MLEHLFKLKTYHSTLTQELYAGLVTFLTMAYIAFVNPSLLSLSGLSPESVFLATILVAAIGSIAMGLIANLPFAIAPGMGTNAFFTFSVVLGMGYSPQSALTGVLLAGAVFVLLSLTPLRSRLMEAIPLSLQHAITVGIGLFIAFIGLRSSGIIVESKGTLVTLGDVRSLPFLFSVVGLIALFALQRLRIPANIPIVMIVLTLLGTLTGTSATPSALISLPHFGQLNLFSFDFHGIMRRDVFGVLLSFVLVIFFDATGTFLALSQLLNAEQAKSGNPIISDSRYKRALVVDASASVVAAALGSSPATTFLESASGIISQGRTGLTSVTVGVLFLALLFLSPLLSVIPSFATGPVLVFVGLLMFSSVKDVDFTHKELAFSSAAIILMTPLTYSITNGIAAGFVVYSLVQLFTGKGKHVHPLLYLSAAVFLLTLYLGGSA